MKAKAVIVLVGIFATCFLALLLLNRPKEQPSALQIPSEQVAGSTNAEMTPTSPNHSPAAAIGSELVPASNPAAWIEKRLKQKAEELESGKNEWRTPINFYGRVLDENEKPVAGVSIDFGRTDLSAEGYSRAQTESDSQGLFSLKEKTGKHLSVRISKNGYYTSKADNNNFTFAGENQILVIAPDEPITFHLRAKGKGEPLIAMNKNFRVARDGTPLEIDLLGGKAVPMGQGHLRIECWTQDQGKKRGEKYDWKCKVSVPGGGMFENTNEFAFLAPEGGYQESFEILMPASLEREWKKDVERQLYFKLGNGMYGRMTFAMIAAGDHFCIVGTLTNPSGSRNLEFDPAVQPKPTQFE